MMNAADIKSNDPNFPFSVVVHFVGPETLCLNCPTEPEQAALYARLKSAMEQDNVVVEIEDKLSISSTKILYLQKVKR